jgi:hypothetical protein
VPCVRHPNIFFSATIGLSIVTSIMILAPGVPTMYRALLFVPNVALANSMACCVYRAIKLGSVENAQSMGSIRPHAALDETGHEFALKRSTINNPRGIQVKVDITRTTDWTDDDDGAAKAEADNQV